MSRLPRQCGILNISQPYRPPRPVTEIDFLFGFITNLEQLTVTQLLRNLITFMTLSCSRRPASYRPVLRPATHFSTVGLDDMQKWKFLTLPGLELGPLSRLGEIRRLSAQYYAGLCTHPNLLATQLSRPSAFRRLRRHLLPICPHGFTV
jgi:hypothetical protein